MERMSEHTGLISSLSLLHVQTQAARWKAATPEQLTGAHLYLDIAKSGYLCYGFSNGMPILHSQYCGCSWPGDTRSQGMSNHDIYNVEQD